MVWPIIFNTSSRLAKLEQEGHEYHEDSDEEASVNLKIQDKWYNLKKSLGLGRLGR